MLDYADLLLAPLYDAFGVDATLTLADTAATEIAVTAIDKTAGIEVGQNVEVGTVIPGAVIRASDLTAAGFSRDDLDEATIAFSGNNWRIASHHPKPVPSGELAGEIVLVLELDNG